ncbi:MAG: hypothetical protein K8R21_07955, partial [Leptospira sp.]|nr:hypothetical protein [Leptospira sp.]
GLTGLGTTVKPSEQELESLVEYDFSLMKLVEELEKKIMDFKNSIIGAPDSGVLDTKISELCSEIGFLNKTFKERKKIFLKL